MRNKYPYTDFHELNADWLLETVKEAVDEAGSMNDRVTTLEGGMRDVASSVSDLTAGVGRLSSAVTDLTDRVDDAEDDIDTLDTKVGEANADIATLQDEVETPTTGLLDRVTALENAPAGQSNAVLYLEFDSSLISVDPSNAWDARITYDYLKSYYPLNTSGEGLQEVKLYDINTQRVFSLNQFHKQESVTPNGGFTFTCRVPNYSSGSLVSYNNYGVVVAQSATTPAYTETVEIPLPEVSSADSGSFLAVDENGEWGLDQPGSGISYSSNEQVVGKWIDSSTIYSKTIYISNLPNASQVSVSHSIVGFNHLVKIEGVALSTSVNIPIPYVNTDVTNQCAVYCDSTSITVNTGGNLSQYSAYITLFYTKV